MEKRSIDRLRLIKKLADSNGFTCRMIIDEPPTVDVLLERACVETVADQFNQISGVGILDLQESGNQFIQLEVEVGDYGNIEEVAKELDFEIYK